MSKTAHSIRQWILSFLLVDLGFWFLVGFSCTFNPLDCLMTAGFGSYFFYLPWSLIPFPWLVSFESAWLSLLLFAIPLILIHGLLGALVGFFARKKRFSWLISILTSLAILLALAMGFGKWVNAQELARETYTDLWAVYEVGGGRIELTKVEFIEDQETPNGFTLIFEEGRTTQILEKTSQTEVYLITCEDGDCVSTEELSFTTYLEAHNACREDPLTCPYYGLGGEYELFEVTSNPKGILKMVQKYVP